MARTVERNRRKLSGLWFPAFTGRCPATPSRRRAQPRFDGSRQHRGHRAKRGIHKHGWTDRRDYGRRLQGETGSPLGSARARSHARGAYRVRARSHARAHAYRPPAPVPYRLATPAPTIRKPPAPTIRRPPTPAPTVRKPPVEPSRALTIRASPLHGDVISPPRSMIADGGTEARPYAPGASIADVTAAVRALAFQQGKVNAEMAARLAAFEKINSAQATKIAALEEKRSGVIAVVQGVTGLAMSLMFGMRES